ncbi:hypothetical protein [Phascolarctobacterium succinatutens]|uniref:hypothetical protein n=1 Tax=Phascolarctobacterium succinatutens TaxID=626940 RepID=UPI0026F224F1|nr:hypothetical protein [Phascolarctobacterium succinatutens]
MKYEDLKARFNHFSKCDETYVTIPREYLLTLIGELLRLRRRVEPERIKVKLMMPVLTVKKQIFKHMV